MSPSDAKIEVVGVNALQRRFKILGDAIGNTQALYKVGNLLMTKIKERTAEGRDVEGKYFKGYSDQYAFFRKKKGLPTAKVDLFFTGSMMNSMTFSVNPIQSEVRIYFSPGTDKKGQSNPAKAYWNQQRRNFFGVAKEDRAEAGRIYRRQLVEGMKRG